MDIATLSQLKKELSVLDKPELIAICTRIVRHKKENKELLHYLVFERSNEHSYIRSIEEEMEEQFELLNNNNLYWAKKSVRKILRNLNKYIRFSGQPETEIELRIIFCNLLKNRVSHWQQSTVLVNMYERQKINIEKALSKLHPDQRLDYEQELYSL